MFLLTGFLYFQSTGQEFEIIYHELRAVQVVMKESCPSDWSIRKEGSSSVVLGNWSNENGKITFTPLVPLSFDVTYELICGTQIRNTFSVKNTNRAPPKIMGVYPESDTLPENLLKFYIEFSRPMAGGKSYRWIKLFSTVEEENAFLELENELWNEDNTILTVWLDPGRIKRDLAPNQDLGNPLKQGSTYTLRISEDWQDTFGNGLDKGFSASFFVGPRDEEIIDPSRWTVSLPEDPGDPVVVYFHEKLDHELLKSAFFLERNDQFISTKFSIRDDKVLEVFSESKWEGGQYTLRIDPVLEDLSGNNLSRPFDHDLLNPVKPSISYLRFEIQ